MRFSEYLKSKISMVSKDSVNMFLEEFSNKSDERNLMTSFNDLVLKSICNAAEVLPKRQLKYSFFGHHSSPDDLQVTHENNKILLECKVLVDRRLYEVRNAFTQLLEYLIEGKWREGYVLIFDKRQNAEVANLFGDDANGQLNHWFVSKFSLEGFPLPGLKISSNIILSAIRIYKGSQAIGVELCKDAKNFLIN